jgi:regulator of sirC expression with transglutaminase-like and TPR domain
MVDPVHALTAIGQLSDDEIDIADAALQLARLRDPSADWRRAAAHLSDLAREAATIGRTLGDRPPEVRLGALAALIHARHAYAGDIETFDDLANADLIRVTERRRGLPVALGIVWLHCLRAAGWHGCGVDVPRHFLIRLDSGPAATAASALLVDVFAAGRIVTRDEVVGRIHRRSTDPAELPPNALRAMTNRQVLLRLQRNIAERRRAAGDWEDALAVLEAMAAIAPDESAVWHDQAVVLQLLGRLRAAIACLERVVALSPDAQQADHARERIDAMRRRLA